MRQMIRWIAVFALPVLLLTGSLVEAQKKPNAEKDLEKSTDKMVKMGVYIGKVMAVYEDKKKVRIQVTYPVRTIDPAAYQRIADAQRGVATATRQSAYQAQVALMQAQASMYKVEYKTTDVEVQATDEVVVRMLNPKEDFDDKGKPKKYTKKEKDELRGPDKKLPGYKAEFGDITTDQYIQVSLVRKKGSPVAARLPKKGKGKDKDEGAEADLIADNAPQASLIVIVREPAQSKK